MYPPELVPGIESEKLKESGLGITVFKFSKFVKEGINKLINSSLMSDKFSGGTPLLLILFPYLLAIAYRWSLKSSSLIWLPLIWVVGWKKDHQITDENQQLQFDLVELRHTAWAKLTMGYTFIVIFAMTILPLEYFVINHCGNTRADFVVTYR